jgi:hypothetical protein
LLTIAFGIILAFFVMGLAAVFLGPLVNFLLKTLSALLFIFGLLILAVFLYTLIYYPVEALLFLAIPGILVLTHFFAERLAKRRQNAETLKREQQNTRELQKESLENDIAP